MADRIAVFHDDRIFDHNTGHGFFEADPSPYLEVTELHPENDVRVRNMVSVLKRGPIAEAVDWHGAEPADMDMMALFHDRAYLDELAAIPAGETRWYSGTTVFGPGSFTPIRVAAGLAVGAARHVWSGAGKIAYATSRPPGHHAQPAMADGYCFVNNIGVAIEVLRQDGMKRCAVIDWDVHHGNGTQEGFYADPDVLTISMHMDHGAWGPTHEQTGAADEVGTGAGKGANLNVPLPMGSSDSLYLAAFDRLVAPAVEAFDPEILFIACGQDANQFDLNGRQLVTMNGFHALGTRARALADRLTGGRLVLVQEGGYAISYAAYCLHATLDGVLDRAPGLKDPIAYMLDRTDNIDGEIGRISAAREAVLSA